MKNIFNLVIVFCTLIFSYTAKAQKAEVINIKGEIFYGVRSIPNYVVVGLYKYEGKGEPIVQLNPDGTGLFQRHGVPADKIRWWIMADENGSVKTNKGEIGQMHTLITQNTEDIFTTVSGGRKVLSYPKDDYDMKMLTIRYAENKIYILGERVKSAKE